MIRQLQQIIAFLREHRTGALTLCLGVETTVIFVMIFILFWYLPIVKDVRSILNHLSHEENAETFSGKNFEKNVPDYDKEKIVIAVNDDLIKALDHAEILIKGVKQSISSTEDIDKKITSGINDTLGKWEISVYDDNPYNLKLGSRVIIGNKMYGNHQPSAIFEVVSIAKKRDNSYKETDIFMNSSSAEFLDIPNPIGLGLFHVTLRILPINK